MSNKKIVVDPDKCIGCNTCVLLEPDVYELNQETFKAFVKKQPPVINEQSQTTVDSCPVGAISIVDSD